MGWRWEMLMRLSVKEEECSRMPVAWWKTHYLDCDNVSKWSHCTFTLPTSRHLHNLGDAEKRKKNGSFRDFLQRDLINEMISYRRHITKEGFFLVGRHSHILVCYWEWSRTKEKLMILSRKMVASDLGKQIEEWDLVHKWGQMTDKVHCTDSTIH